MNTTVKIAVLGGGPAGYVAAIRAAQLGADVTLIEKDALGGVCTNMGCIPTKALLKSSEVVDLVTNSKEFGISPTGSAINWEQAISRKDRITKNLRTGLAQLMEAKGITVIAGTGSLISPNEIEIAIPDNVKRITFDKAIIATGSSPAMPSIDGISLDGVIDSTDALSLPYLPSSVVVIGAGVIGLEFATMWNAAGVKVTVIEMAERILADGDSEISAEQYKVLKRQGIAIKLSSQVQQIMKTDAGLSVSYIIGGKASEAVCDTVLVATGRKLNTDLIGSVPLEIQDGHVVVDETMETSVKGIYAAGDIIGGKLLAHLAFAEGKVAAENAMGLSNRVNHQAIPTCVYTTPEIATVGYTEEEARAKGIAVRTGRFAFRHNGRALTLSAREGYVKVVADDKGVILGGQIMGEHASEMISEITLAITLGATADVLADMIHPHPSMSEAIWEACADLAGRPLHQ